MANRQIPVSKYWSGQGQLIFAERDPATGLPINAFRTGNAPAIELQINTTQSDHRESMSGQRSIDYSLVTEKNATVNITLESFTMENLILGLWGSTRSVDAGTVAAEPHTVDSAKGGLTILAHANVSNVVITSNATAVGSEAYVVDPDYGTIQWNPEFTPAITGEVTIAYEYDAGTFLDALTESSSPERYVRFEGINTVDDSLKLVEMPRVQFQPLQSYGQINEEIAQIQVVGTVLPDPFITTGSKYYRERDVTPTP